MINAFFIKKLYFFANNQGKKQKENITMMFVTLNINNQKVTRRRQ